MTWVHLPQLKAVAQVKVSANLMSNFILLIKCFTGHTQSSPLAIVCASWQCKHQQSKSFYVNTILGTGSDIIVNDDPFTIELNALMPLTLFESLLKLDGFESPGLPSAKFYRLFTKCQCSLIMTHDAYKYHKCMFKNVMIDLT